MEQKTNIEAFQFITTDESYHEGLNYIDDYIDQALEKKVSALALIDRCSLGMVVKFHKKCMQNNIKPIIGSKFRLDFPELDYKDAYLRNIETFKKIKEIKFLENNDNVFESLGINFNLIFSSEKSFIEINKLKELIDKNTSSKSKTKRFVLYRDISKFLRNISEDITYEKLGESGIINPVEIFYSEEVQKSLDKGESSNIGYKQLDTALKNYIKMIVSDNEIELTEEQKKALDKIKFYDNDKFISNDELVRSLIGDESKDIDIIRHYDISDLNKKSLNNEYHFDIDNFKNLIVSLDTNIKYGDLIAIAMNDEGYKNIKKLITLSFKNGQSKIPLKDGKREVDTFPLTIIDDIQDNKSGILFVSTNDSGDILSKYNVEHKRSPIALAKIIKEKLGQNFMFSIKSSMKQESPELLKNEAFMISSILDLSENLDIPVFASHDVRFSKESEYPTFDLKKAVLLNQTTYDPSREKTVFSGQYMLSDEEFSSLFKSTPNLLENNIQIKDQVTTNVRLNYYVLPKFDVPVEFEFTSLRKHFNENNIEYTDNQSSDDLKSVLYSLYYDDYKSSHPVYFDEEIDKTITNIVAGDYMNHLAWEGVVSKLKIDYGDEWKEHEEEYKDRFNYESKVINEMGFPSYFLIVYDFIRYAKKEADVPVGPGRGSGAGSLIAYGLDITDIDPIPSKLFFERFLNPERVSMPDFDIDFSQEGRQKIINYVKNKYGEVSQIATQGRYQPKSAMRGVLKARGVTIPYQDRILEEFPDAPDLTMNMMRESEEFIATCENNISVNDIFEEAFGIYGTKSNSGLHAGGVVIAPFNLYDHAPVQQLPNGEGKAVQFDKKDIEIAGLVKFDFLGLKTLDIIKEALKQAKESGYDIDIRTINKSDEKTFKLLKKALTHGVFQLESGGMTELVKQLQVENIEEMSALVALYRPGPMQSGMMDNYIDRKKGLEEIDSMHFKLEEVLKDTYGTMIYQEQVMQAAQILANYTMGGADQLRRAMGSKNADEMTRNKSLFNNGALKANLEEDNAISSKQYNEEINSQLSDISNSLNIENYLSEDGFFANENLVEEYMSKELNMGEDDISFILSKINNKDFKFEIMYENYKDLLKEKNWDHELSDACKKLKNKIHQKYSNDTVSNRIYSSIVNFSKYNSIFFKIEQFAAYGFNKAHSLSYATLSYQTAYLKANHTKEFFAALCSFHSDDQKLTMQDKIRGTVYDMKSNFNIPMLSPSVNKSFYRFTVEGDGVRYGLRSLKGLGDTGLVIEKERTENGDFLSLEDFVFRMDYRNKLEKTKNTKVSKRTFEALLYSGGFDEFLPDSFPDKSLGRNFLYEEYSLLVNTKTYPKDDIMDIVEKRLIDGKYSNELVYVKNEKFNPLQNLICLSIAYTKIPEELFFNEEEIKENKSSVTQKKALFLKEHKILTSEFNSLKPLDKDSDLLKLYKKSIALSKKGFFENLDEIKELIGTVKFDEVNISDGLDGLLKKLENAVFEIKEADPRYNELSNELKIIFLKTEIDLIKKNNLINFLPEGLKELPTLFNEKNKNTKVKNIIQFIKEKNPEALKVISSKVKEVIKIESKFILESESEKTGLYLSGHPVSINNAQKRFELERERKDISYITSKAKDDETMHEVDSEYFNVVGVINNVEVKKIKTGKNAGKDWVSFTIQDETETIKVRMYSELYHKAKDYLEDGNVLGVSMQVSVDPKWGLQGVVNEFKVYSPDMGDRAFINENTNTRKHANN